MNGVEAVLKVKVCANMAAPLNRIPMRTTPDPANVMSTKKMLKTLGEKVNADAPVPSSWSSLNDARATVLSVCEDPEVDVRWTTLSTPPNNWKKNPFPVVPVSIVSSNNPTRARILDGCDGDDVERTAPKYAIVPPPMLWGR